MFGQQGSDNPGSNQKTSLLGGRWEFFMSEIAARGTYKIDKYTGRVYVMVLDKEDESLTWQFVDKEKNNKDIQKQGLINYQLFSSGIAMRHTYLLNTNTGLVWQLVTDEDGILYFQIIE
jgi:hypothetical protein